MILLDLRIFQIQKSYRNVVRMQDLIINYRHHIKQRPSETVFRLSDDLLSNDAKYHLVNLACASVSVGWVEIQRNHHISWNVGFINPTYGCSQAFSLQGRQQATWNCKSPFQVAFLMRNLRFLADTCNRLPANYPYTRPLLGRRALFR